MGRHSYKPASMTIIEAAQPSQAEESTFHAVAVDAHVSDVHHIKRASRADAPVATSEAQTQKESLELELCARDSRTTAEIPVVFALPASTSEVAGNNFAEHMNAQLLHGNALHGRSSHSSGVKLFTRSRALVAAMVAATCSMSVGAMAATNESPKSTVSAMTLTEGDASLGAIDGLPDVAFSVESNGATRELSVKVGTTLGDALSEAGIEIDGDDVVSLGLDSIVRNGMKIKVVNVETKTLTEQFTDAFKEKREDDASLPKGEERVETEGVDGKGTRTFTVVYHDGKEESRSLVAETVTTKRVDKVIKVGTGTDLTATQASGSGPVSVPNRVVSGSKADWMRAAGIPESQWGYVDYIVSKESSWNPNAVNSSSGACGLAQALPCSKLGPNWNDPVVALRWQQNYVNSRYGGYAGAVAHSKATGWY